MGAAGGRRRRWRRRRGAASAGRRAPRASDARWRPHAPAPRSTAAGRRRASARERGALAALIVAAVAAWALVPTYPDYDAYHAPRSGAATSCTASRPAFETFAAPTEHPLYLALAALLSLAGEHADRLLVLVDGAEPRRR